MKNTPFYRKPLFAAIALHAVLVLVLVLSFAPTQFRYPAALQNSAKVIQVNAVSEIAVSTQVHAIEKAQHEAAEKLVAEKQAKIALALKIKEEIQLKKLQAQRIEQAKIAATQKALAEKEKQKKLLAAQKKLQQALVQQQLQSEKKELLQVQTQENQGVIDKYKAEILSLIQSNWRIPTVNDQLQCVYSVSVAPGGVILSINLVKSGGDAALDQSAKTAIVQSSPLPVPTESDQFDHFRQLILTLSPKGYMNIG